MSRNDDLRGENPKLSDFVFVFMHVCNAVITLDSDVDDPNAGRLFDAILHLKLPGGCDSASPTQKPSPHVQKQTLLNRDDVTLRIMEIRNVLHQGGGDNVGRP